MLSALLIALGQTGAEATPAATAVAEESDQSGPEEIIVRGERVKRSLKDTPSSLNVVTERELSAMPADRVEQVLAGIPNVQLGNGSAGPSIRGQDTTGVLQALAAFLGGARPRATLEVDGRAAGFQEFVFGSAPLWDVRQIEVYRSPLTVTHGRNSIAGGIVVATNDPSYDWEARARLIGGDFATRQASAVVSGPIVADQLAFRLAGDIRTARVTAKLADVIRGANPNDDQYSQLRFKLLGEPASLPGLKIVGTFIKTDARAPQEVLVYRPFRRREYPYGGYGVIDVNVTAATFHASQEIAGGQVDAVVSLGKTRTRRYAEPGFGEFRARLKDVSGEIFGKWKPTDSITLRAGVHALDSRFRQHIDVSRNFVGSIGNFRDHQNSFGLFGEVEAAFTDRLSASVGGRYQQDRQQRTGELVGRTNASIDFDERFSAFLPRAVASYAITPRLKAGVLIQKAYNPGGATFNVFTGELDTFKAETLWNYEAFLKGNLAGGRVTIEANIFYNDITDSQRSVITPITRPDGQPAFVVQFNNVPRASVRGAEVELSWRASPKLALSGGVGLQRTKIRSSQNSDGDIIGREFQRAPHFTGNVAADWTPTDRLRLSAQLRYHSDYFSDDFDTPELRIPDAAIVDARAAYALKKFTLFAYAQNLFDHFSLNYRFSSDVASADDPRVVGAGIEARF